MPSYRPRGGFQQPTYRSSFYDEPSRSRSPRRTNATDDANNDRTSSRYRDRSRGRRDEKRHTSRDRSRSRPSSSGSDRDRDRRSGPGRPSREVMMDKIPLHVTENDIKYELEHNYNVRYLDDVRIIKDRQTRQSRGFGFLRFRSLKDAQTFMDANFPTVFLYGDSAKGYSSKDSKVFVTYSKERDEDDTPKEPDWICAMCNADNFGTRAKCRNCLTAKPLAPPEGAAIVHTGDDDVSLDDVPSQFLLFRGLASSVSEEVFARGAAKLNKPESTDTDHTIQTGKRSKVPSATGDSSLGSKEGSLRRVLLVRDKGTDASRRYGFAEYATVDDAQDALKRYSSFSDFTIASKAVSVSYIHSGVFVPIPINNTTTTDKFSVNVTGNAALRVRYRDSDAYIAELVVNETPLVNADDGDKSPNKSKDDGSKATSEADKNKKRKANTELPNQATKKVTATHLDFWSKRHAELHNGGTPSKQNSTARGSGSATSVLPADLLTFADPVRKSCWLCMVSFNTEVGLCKHERGSEVHKANLSDEAKVERAKHKLAKHGITRDMQLAMFPPPRPEAKPEYRDRARERRQVYGVVNKKGEQVSNKKRVNLGDDSDGDGAIVAPVSKGASLLSKMGYTAGQGLGATGTGMTAPIAQNVYAAGVGLGAEGGKLGDAVQHAEKQTKNDYGAFVEETREKAKERYNRMS